MDTPTKEKKKTTVGHVLLSGLIMGIVIIFMAYKDKEDSLNPPVPPKVTPEDISRMRMNMLKEMVKESAKDPDSINFLEDYYDENTSCVKYTGTNGFGGRVRGVASLHKGVFSTSFATFKKVC